MKTATMFPVLMAVVFSHVVSAANQEWHISVKTGDTWLAGTDAHVFMELTSITNSTTFDL